LGHSVLADFKIFSLAVQVGLYHIGYVRRFV